MKKHGLTSEEYLKLYPGSPLYNELDNKNTSKNSGKHMKKEKYRKMFSEKFSGEKNPNSKSKTTEEERKQRSPFSKSFIKYENEDEALNFSRKVNNLISPEKRPNRVEYWINKGYSPEESEQKVSERQKTFTLEKCIEKYGEEKGKKRWINRQKKWLDNYKKVNFSAISQKLFWQIYEKLENKENIFFATLKNGETDFSRGNNEIRLELNNIIIKPDFYQEKGFKIIEFDGTYYHRITPENKKRTENRDKEIIESCYEVLHVNEHDYKKNPDKVLQDCLNFLEIKK